MEGGRGGGGRHKWHGIRAVVKSSFQGCERDVSKSVSHLHLLVSVVHSPGPYCSSLPYYPPLNRPILVHLFFKLRSWKVSIEVNQAALFSFRLLSSRTGSADALRLVIDVWSPLQLSRGGSGEALELDYWCLWPPQAQRRHAAPGSFYRAITIWGSEGAASVVSIPGLSSSGFIHMLTWKRILRLLFVKLYTFGKGWTRSFRTVALPYGHVQL